MDEDLANQLLCALEAHLADPEDRAAEAALADIEARMRSGPVPHAGEVVLRRYLLRGSGPAGELTTPWEGRDLVEERDVTVVFLHPQHLGRPDRIAAFRASVEAQAAAGPVVAEVVAPVSDWHGFLVAVLDAPAPSLEAVLDALDPGGERVLAVEVAEAVAELHDRGQVHGALAPGAVLADAHGVRLSFLGLTDGGAGRIYLPPEAAAPEWEPARASDVYALALLVLRILTREPLPWWVARQPERLLERLGDDPVVPVLAEALDWRPEARPSTEALANALLGDEDHRRALALAALAEDRPELAVRRLRELVAAGGGTDDAVALAAALGASGKPAEAARVLADALEAGAGVDHLPTLQALAAQASDDTELVRGLEALARPEREGRDEALLALARHLQRREAWQAALDGHRTRAQACEALSHLVAGARERGDAREETELGRRLASYLDEGAEAAALCHRLGHVFLDVLDDPDNALLWFDRALERGFDAADLGETLHRLRSDRGEWSELVDLLEASGGDDLLRQAAWTARWALTDEARANRLDAALVERGIAEPAVVRRLAASAPPSEGAELLERLQAPSPADLCRLADVLMGAGRPDDARATLRRGLAEHPHHLGLLDRALALAELDGDRQGVTEAAAAIAGLVGPGDPRLVEAQLALAEVALADGELERAARLLDEVLLEDRAHLRAWWARVRIAWRAVRTDAEPAWLRAAPPRFPAQEALARLIASILDRDAVRAWLSVTPGDAPDPQASPLELAGEVVERLSRHGLVDDRLFDQLEGVFDDQEGWVQAVRLLWRGATGSDRAFPVAQLQASSGGQHDFRAPAMRVPVGPGVQQVRRDPAALDRDDLWDVLLIEAEAHGLSQEGSAPRLVEEEPRPAVIVDEPAGARRVWIDDEVGLPEEAPRLTLVLRASEVYVVADEPVTVDGVQTTETRLQDGARIVAGDLRVAFQADAAHGPALELPPDDEVEEPDDPTWAGPEPDPIRAALFYRLDGSEHILPLVDPEVEVGTGRILREALGMYTLSLPDEPERMLLEGETFQVDGVAYTFQIVEARTPAPARRRESARAQQVPVLCMDDGSLLGRVVPITKMPFTIGRGRGNDLQLSADAKLSRHHCTLVAGPDGTVRIRDAGSSHGTQVDGHTIEEIELYEGAAIRIGDTELELRWGDARGVLEVLPEDDDIEELELDEERPSHAGPVTVEDGRAKVEACNAALSVIMEALDDADGTGRGRAVLQLAVDSAPTRFQPLFAGLEAKPTGLPELALLFNVAQRPEPAQRPLLNQALLDLVERLTSQAVETLPEAAVDPMLLRLSETGFKDRLRT